MDRQVSSELRFTFFVHAIVSTVFGLIYLLIPVDWGNWTGQPLDARAAVYARLVGAALLALGVSSWLAAFNRNWREVILVVRLEIVWTVLAALVLLWAIVSGVTSGVSLIYLILMAAFAIAFSVFYSPETKPQPVSPAARS